MKYYPLNFKAMNPTYSKSRINLNIKIIVKIYTVKFIDKKRLIMIGISSIITTITEYKGRLMIP